MLHKISLLQVAFTTTIYQLIWEICYSSSTLKIFCCVTYFLNNKLQKKNFWISDPWFQWHIHRIRKGSLIHEKMHREFMIDKKIKSINENGYVLDSRRVFWEIGCWQEVFQYFKHETYHLKILNCCNSYFVFRERK